MVIQPGLFIPQEAAHIAELLQNIGIVLHAPVTGLILHVQRLRHIKTVQPDLVRINILVPEITAFAPRMAVQALHMILQRLAVSPVPCLVDCEKQKLAAVQVIQIIMVRFIGRNASVLQYPFLQVTENVFLIRRIAGGFVHALHAHQKAAVLIIPVFLVSLIPVKVISDILVNPFTHSTFPRILIPYGSDLCEMTE